MKTSFGEYFDIQHDAIVKAMQDKNKQLNVEWMEAYEKREHLKILQRHALNYNWGVLRKMIAELPDHRRGDTLEMLKKTNNDLGKVFPDIQWFQKRADESKHI